MTAPAEDALLARLLAQEKGGAARGGIPRRPEGAEAPLSFAQRRLWFIHRLLPESAAYNISAAFRLKGALDAALFERSLRAVAARHEVLRSVFAAGADGEPGQRARPAEQDPLEYAFEDVSGAADAAARARAVAEAEAARPFDLERGPLVRVRVLKLGPAEHAVACTLPHIVSDGGSTGIFIREVGAHYAALAAGRPAALPPLAVQYADYAAWQRSPAVTATAEASVNWWRQRLEGLPELELPADFPRPPVQSFRGGRVAFAVSAATRNGLAETARRQGATVFAAALAAYQAALAAWSGQKDFAVGSPVAGRIRRELEPLVGLFVNTLVLRADLGGDPSFAELVGRARDAAQAALARQDAPFDRLVEELNPERSLSRTPLAQAVLSFEHAPDGGLALPGLALEPIEPEGVSAKFDFTLSLTDSPGGMKGALDYAAEVFAPETAAQFIRLFERFLAAAAAAPERRLSELLAPETRERDELARLGRGVAGLVEAGDIPGSATPAATVPLAVIAQAERHPGKIAIRDGERSVSYGELLARASALAARLREHEVGPERVAAVCLPRSIELVAAQLGIWLAGGAYLPLDPSHPAGRLRGMIADAGAKAVVTDAAGRGIFEGAVPVVEMAAVAGVGDPGKLPASARPATSEQLAYVIFTSGSTGRPKGVAVSHGALANLCAWHREAFGLTGADTATLLAGQGFDASVWELWPALAAGACVSIVPPEAAAHPEALRDWLAAGPATVSFVPTPMAELILSLPWPERTPLRWMLTGGDRLRSAPPAGLPFRLSNNYGPTEHAVVATSGPVEPGPTARAPDIGRPIGRGRLHLLGPDLRPVPLGAVGEICLSGPSLARGYLGRPDLTAELFRPDPASGEPGARMYRTGDLARWRPDGALEFRGRADQQVKVRGVRIELGEVEAALLALPGVREAAAGVRRVGAEPALIAWLAGGPGEAAAREQLREALPAAMIPAHWVRLERLPLTPNGKIDRRALLDPDPAGAAGGEPPATPLEAEIAAVWSEALGRPGVGVDRSFFDIGGHSLLLARVHTMLQQRLQRPVTLIDLFAHPTVRALARHLEGDAAAAGGELAEAARRGAAQREALERRRRTRTGGGA